MVAEDNMKMDGKSLDITKENIAALKQLFPEIVEEGKIDFDRLKTILGEEVDSDDERYNFTWHGKNLAIRISQTPSMGTLRPCKEESVDWDTTQNLYIEGDNLEVLKLLQKSYFGKVKMIYIDPPYNTGNDFVYSDDYSDSISNYKLMTNQVDGIGKDISTNSETAGKYHTNWLNMIYPRLKLARNLLRNDGLIFISIDENEIVNLRKICDEIFGQSSFIAQITLLCNPKGRSQDKYVANCHEYLLVYSKTILPAGSLSIPKTDEEIKKDYQLSDVNGVYRELELRNTHRDFGKFNRPKLWYPFYVGIDGALSLEKTEDATEVFPTWDDGFEGCWTWGLEKSMASIDLLVAKKVNGKTKIYRKAYAASAEEEAPLKQVKSIWTDSSFFTEKGQGTLNTLFETKDKIFQSPKSIFMLIQCIQMSHDKDGIVLDFFSGSATTAHAVMEINRRDGGNRKCICVQLPSRLNENTGALDFKTICDIGKERIRRAGNEIKRIQSHSIIDGHINNIDVGFKVFKLDSSNVKKWNPGADVKQTLIDYQNNIASDSGRTDLDIVYEIILKMGLDLTSIIDEIDVAGATMYSISSGALMVCLDDIKDTTVAEKMISIHKEQNPPVWKVVFKDNGFASDDVKANTRETLKMAGLSEGSFVTL